MWAEARKALNEDKVIGPLIKKYGKCDLKKRPKSEYFESLVRAIVGQQLSVKAASTIYGRVEELLAGDISPERILSIDDEKFRSAGLSYRKVSYIKDLSEKVKSGEVEISKFDKLSNEKVTEELVAVKGIGNWTAEMFLMFALARSDIFPVDNLGIRNAFKKSINDKATEEEMEKYAKRWKPWRSYTSWYLWRSLENLSD